MGKFEDLTNQKFGRLTVIKRFKDESKKTKWECLCDCGNTKTIDGSNLKNGHTKSCGCYLKEFNASHNMYKTKIYAVWSSMKRRCNCKNKNSKYYKNYTARNIKLCDEWNDFLTFYEWAIKNGYQEGLTIDRIDNNGDYTPENCRWITNLEQQNNKRNNHFIEYNNEVHTIAEWSRILGIKYSTLANRIQKGYDIEKVFEKVVSKC